MRPVGYPATETFCELPKVDSGPAPGAVSVPDLRKVIRGALIQTINDHGPITKATVESAAKRINGSVREALKR